MKKKRELPVVYIITQLELGGAQKVCLSLFKKLRDTDTLTFLIAGPLGPLAKTVHNHPQVDLIPELQQESFFTAIKCFFLLIKKLRALKKKYPDLIVHTHSTTAGLLGRWAAFCAGVRTRIHTVHGYAFHAHCSYTKWIAIWLCEFLTSLITNHFVCVSSQDVKTGINYFPSFANKHSIIRAAVEYDAFKKASCIDTYKKTGPFIFGTISCFKPQKNLFDLLKAFKLVHTENPNTRLEIIGDGALRAALEETIAQYQLTQVVTLHGWQEHVVPYMRNWHAFTLSSLWEGLPCAVVEARLLKLPVISYNTGGITDVIFHTHNGLIYNQKEWASLADGMLKMSIENGLHKKLQEHNDQLAEFTQENMIQEHARLYTQLHKLHVTK